MIRTRFAPSPTGYLHVGGLRTALYSYLHAKKNEGEFILRIEDTDQKREVKGATAHLLEMLEWAGLYPDEGPGNGGPHKPYIQSQRTEIYQKYANQLLEEGHAYRCFCTAERLKEMREHQEKSKKAPMYDRHCLYLSEEEIQKNLDEKKSFVIRQKIPLEKLVKFKDLVRGNVTFAAKTLDDQVLLKSDGFPTYQLANVIDDHLMEITHVIRGEEWLPSTPKHILLYEALNWDPPEFAHIPLLLNKDRSKLSKRQGDVSVEDYIKKGYQKEAIINFIAFLGWHPGGESETEIFNLEELIDHFSIEKVHKAGAIFDIDKLDWFNWQWKRRKFHEDLYKYARDLEDNVDIQSPKKGEFIYNFHNEKNADEFFIHRTDELKKMCFSSLNKDYRENDEKLRKALVTVEEKILKDHENINDYIKFYFEDIEYDTDLLTHEKMKVDYKTAKESLSKILEKFENFYYFDNEEKIKGVLLEAVEELGFKNGQVFWPLRAALTGEQYSPGVFEVAWVIGKDLSIERIKKALEKLEKAG
jgi:glutamyl-tRNA synthetase